MSSLSIFTRLHIRLQRLVRWEFWPWQVVYLPVAVYWFFLAIKAKGWVFFSAANPCMRFGGLVAYSKADVSKLVPRKYLPKTIILEPGAGVHSTEQQMAKVDLCYPMIIKPDMGERGKGVKILETKTDLEDALTAIKERSILQTYEDLSLELGIMYSRHPSEENGKITSIVVKEFPYLTGDGKSTLQQLILSNLRTRLSYEVHFKRFKNRLNEVVSVGQTIQIVSIGNHMLGTTFKNGNHLISSELEEVFDEMSKQIDGFYIGRFDLKSESIEELLKRNFKVIEVNGVNSEPCHIYDPNMSLWNGLSDLLRHWKRIYEISIANHENGVAYDSFSDIRKEIKRHNREGAKHD